MKGQERLPGPGWKELSYNGENKFTESPQKTRFVEDSGSYVGGAHARPSRFHDARQNLQLETLNHMRSQRECSVSTTGIGKVGSK